jgi:hypothetical protein
VDIATLNMLSISPATVPYTVHLISPATGDTIARCPVVAWAVVLVEGNEDSDNPGTQVEPVFIYEHHAYTVTDLVERGPIKLVTVNLEPTVAAPAAGLTEADLHNAVHLAAERAISDWLDAHEASTLDALEAAAKQAVTDWLNQSKDQLAAVIATAIASQARPNQ